MTRKQKFVHHSVYQLNRCKIHNQVFTAADLTDMVLVYEETEGNGAQALRRALYQERFPNRRHSRISKCRLTAKRGSTNYWKYACGSHEQ